MRSASLVLAFSFLLAAGAAAPAAAQSPRRAGSDEGRRARLIERIETVRIARMTEALSLDPATAEKLFPAIRPFSERRAEIGRERWTALRGLKKELEGETPDAKRVSALLDQAMEARRALHALEEEEYEVLRKILEPVMLARYYAFHREFERDVQGIVREIKGKAGKAGKWRTHPRKDGGPANDAADRP